jgi:hypothetical protein
MTCMLRMKPHKIWRTGHGQGTRQDGLAGQVDRESSYLSWERRFGENGVPGELKHHDQRKYRAA